jgi:hypothetical protein
MQATRWRRTRRTGGVVGSTLLLAGAGVLVGTTANATGTSTIKSGQAKTQAPIKTATTASPLAAPGGYVVLTTGPFDAPGGVQTSGVATCPGTEVPAGGGALLSPVGSNAGLYASLNTSIPQGHGWAVDVNTVSGFDAHFSVYVVCVNAATSYSIVQSAPVTNPAGSVTFASATCPTNRVPIGGGVQSSSFSTAVNIASSFPNQGSNWDADMANRSASSATMTVYAICRKQPKGYSFHSSIQTMPSGAESAGSVNCPGASLPLSGGVFTAGVLTLNLNSSFPSSSDWVTFENNGDSASWPILTIVICGGT